MYESGCFVVAAIVKVAFISSIGSAIYAGLPIVVIRSKFPGSLIFSKVGTRCSIWMGLCMLGISHS